MSVNFCDSFDAHGSTSDLLLKYASVSGSSFSFNSSAGRFGGGALVGGSGSASTYIVPANVGAATPGVIAFWFKASAAPGSQGAIITMLTANNAGTNGSLEVTTSGYLGLRSYDLQWGRCTGAINVCDNKWHWIEASFGNTGNTKIYVDNTLYAAASDNIMTSSAYSFQISSLPGITTTFDDIIYYDSTSATAPSFSNFPLGARQISVLRPNSDNSVTFATCSTGSTHNTLVNETSSDQDTSYVEDGTSGNKDLLGIGSLAYTPATINAAVVNVVARNSGTGTISIKLACKSSATETDSSGIALGLNYTTKQASFGVDPNTSAAWTSAGLNAAKFGYLNA